MNILNQREHAHYLPLKFPEIFYYYYYFFIGKLHAHPMGLEPTSSPSTLLQREELPFELKLIGFLKNYVVSFSCIASKQCLSSVNPLAFIQKVRGAHILDDIFKRKKHSHLPQARDRQRQSVWWQLPPHNSQTLSNVNMLRDIFNTFNFGAKLKKSPFMKSMWSSTP
jgi:hypothetical protein